MVESKPTGHENNLADFKKGLMKIDMHVKSYFNQLRT
jgi:hypothetical protein